MEYSWDLDKDDPMIINVFHNGNKVLCLFIGEAMESAGREAIMKHVHECDATPWLKNWWKKNESQNR